MTTGIRRVVDKGTLPGDSSRTWEIAKVVGSETTYELTVCAAGGGAPHVSSHAHLAEARNAVGKPRVEPQPKSPTAPRTEDGRPTLDQKELTSRIRGIKDIRRKDGLAAALKFLAKQVHERADEIALFARCRDEWLVQTLPQAAARIEAIVGERRKHYDYDDNHRAARVGDAFQELLYDLAAAEGCCGFYDEEEEVKGVKYKLGFNYGH